MSRLGPKVTPSEVCGTCAGVAAWLGRRAGSCSGKQVVAQCPGLGRRRGIPQPCLPGQSKWAAAEPSSEANWAENLVCTEPASDWSRDSWRGNPPGPGHNAFSSRGDSRSSASLQSFSRGVPGLFREAALDLGKGLQSPWPRPAGRAALGAGCGRALRGLNRSSGFWGVGPVGGRKGRAAV